MSQAGTRPGHRALRQGGHRGIPARQNPLEQKAAQNRLGYQQQHLQPHNTLRRAEPFPTSPSSPRGASLNPWSRTPPPFSPLHLPPFPQTGEQGTTSAAQIHLPQGSHKSWADSPATFWAQLHSPRQLSSSRAAPGAAPCQGMGRAGAQPCRHQKPAWHSHVERAAGPPAAPDAHPVFVQAPRSLPGVCRSSGSWQHGEELAFN